MATKRSTINTEARKTFIEYKMIELEVDSAIEDDAKGWEDVDEVENKDNSKGIIFQELPPSPLWVRRHHSLQRGSEVALIARKQSPTIFTERRPQG
jgi:hypothetical protein